MRRHLAVLLKLRRARAVREAAQVAWMYETYPWVTRYAIFRPGRDWQAMHLPSKALLPPARTPRALQDRILADVQSRPVPPPGRDVDGEWTRVNMPAARRDTQGPPRGGGRL